MSFFTSSFLFFSICLFLTFATRASLIRQVVFHADAQIFHPPMVGNKAASTVLPGAEEKPDLSSFVSTNAHGNLTTRKGIDLLWPVRYIQPAEVSEASKAAVLSAHTSSQKPA